MIEATSTKEIRNLKRKRDEKAPIMERRDHMAHMEMRREETSMTR